jgi:hypothetical protein
MYPDISGQTILEVLGGGTLLAIAGYAGTTGFRKLRQDPADGETHGDVPGDPKEARDTWRMPPLNELPAPRLTLSSRIWMGVLRGYLIVAVCLVIAKVVQMTLLR